MPQRTDKWQSKLGGRKWRAPAIDFAQISREVADAEARFWAKRNAPMEQSMTPREYALTKKNDKLAADLDALKARLAEWQACAKRLAHAYRNNSTKESTRAFVEYARLAAQEEGKQ